MCSEQGRESLFFLVDIHVMGTSAPNIAGGGGTGGAGGAPVDQSDAMRHIVVHTENGIDVS